MSACVDCLPDEMLTVALDPGRRVDLFLRQFCCWSPRSTGKHTHTRQHVATLPTSSVNKIGLSPSNAEYVSLLPIAIPGVLFSWQQRNCRAVPPCFSSVVTHAGSGWVLHREIAMCALFRVFLFYLLGLCQKTMVIFLELHACKTRGMDLESFPMVAQLL